MNDLSMLFSFWLIFLITFLAGYWLGGKHKAIGDEIKEKVNAIIKERPKPGVVNQLSEAQIIEKHDPKKRGNLEAFNRLFQTLGVMEPKK